MPQAYLDELRELARSPDAQLSPLSRFVLVALGAGEPVRASAGTLFREATVSEQLELERVAAAVAASAAAGAAASAAATPAMAPPGPVAPPPAYASSLQGAEFPPVLPPPGAAPPAVPAQPAPFAPVQPAAFAPAAAAPPQPAPPQAPQAPQAPPAIGPPPGDAPFGRPAPEPAFGLPDPAPFGVPQPGRNTPFATPVRFTGRSGSVSASRPIPKNAPASAGIGSRPPVTPMLSPATNPMPSSWAPAALEAQSIAARTYAITTTVDGQGFNLYDDTRSQMYGGVNSETATSDAAVAATAGQVVTYDGAPAVTYFFSSSGGSTESIQNVWPGSAPEPWLRGVPDPYDAAADNPDHSWQVTLTLAAATAKLHGLVDGTLERIVVTRRGVSPRVIAAQVVGSTGTTTVTGSQLAVAFGLLSTDMSFTVG